MSDVHDGDSLRRLSTDVPSFAQESERLLHLQMAIRRIIEQPDVAASASEAVDAMQTLGWRRVVLVLFSPKQKVEQVFSAGTDADDLARYGEYGVSPAIWEEVMAGALEALRRSGIYCLYCDPGPRVEWHDGDIIFGLLKTGQGAVIGVMRVDDPVDGQRPTDAALRALDVLANQTAYVVENARMIEEASRSAEILSDQVEMLSLMHRADRELSTYLDVDRIVRLTMDLAMRRTGAVIGMLMLMDTDQGGLVPALLLGRIDHDMFPYSTQHPMAPDVGLIGHSLDTRQSELTSDATLVQAEFPYLPTARSLVSVPLTMRGEVLGVAVLGAERIDSFRETELDFLDLLVRRSVVALDNARLLKQSEQLADDMTVIYTASRAITSTLERDELLQRIAQVMTVTLECSSAVIFDYHKDTQSLQVLAVYRLGTAQDANEVLPEINEVRSLEQYFTFDRAIEEDRTTVLYANDMALPEAVREELVRARIRSMVLVPLVAQNEVIGVVAVIESRRDRRFSSNDVFRIMTLGSQAAVALRQSMLYNEVLELEKLKSEMIRMASHDLRNPLNNILGYIDLIGLSLEPSEMTPDLRLFMDSLKVSAHAMQSLLEDLLALERIESDRQHDWRQFDFAGLVLEVVEDEHASALLKKHKFMLERPDIQLPVYGSVRQMRQAVSNIIGNAIKYTPDEGRIVINVDVDGGRVHFKVSDNGYGISAERQAQVFERFYRAREPGTDHIPGTGLGLSLVKTVIERHGGEVWFESQLGKGSTFGFWVPKDDGIEISHNQHR